MKKWSVVSVIGAALVVASSVAYAGPLADATADTLWGIQLGGYLDVSYTYQFNDPVNSNNSIVGRAFSNDDNEIQLNAFQLYIDKLPQDAGEAGFRFDILAGEDAQVIGDLWGGDDDISIYQAFISYIAPIGNGLTIDVGRWATPHGYESIESPANDQFTRSLMFTLLQPYTHTGIRFTYPINDQWEVMVGMSEGWDVVDDNNEAWTFHGAVRWMPMENVYIQNSVSYGPENRNHWLVNNVPPALPNLIASGIRSNDDYTLLYDLVATWEINESWTVGANFDYETTEDAFFKRNAVPRTVWSKDADLWGLGLYVRYDVNEDLYLALRGEVLDDSDGYLFYDPTVKDNNIWEVTATLGYTITEGLLTRLEYRHDDADQKIFCDEGAGIFDDQQDTISLEIIYSF